MISIVLLLLAVGVLCLAVAPYASKPAATRFLQFAAAGVAIAAFALTLVASNRLN